MAAKRLGAFVVAYALSTMLVTTVVDVVMRMILKTSGSQATLRLRVARLVSRLVGAA